MKKILVILVILFLLTSCSLDTISLNNAGKVVLISIGLDYESLEITTLKGTVLDSSEFALCLNDIYEKKGIKCETHLLVSDLDKNTLVDLIGNLNIEKNDMVVFYYSGHGLVENSELNLVLYSSENASEYALYSTSDLLNKLEQYKCPCSVIFDCCYSGSAINQKERNFSDIISSLFSKSSYTNISIVASSLSDQVSFVSSLFTEDGVGENHSLFSISLLNELGWVHSGFEERKFLGMSVFGHQDKEISRLSTLELFYKVMSKWKSSTQVPVINRTNIPVMLVP